MRICDDVGRRPFALRGSAGGLQPHRDRVFAAADLESFHRIRSILNHPLGNRGSLHSRCQCCGSLPDAGLERWENRKMWHHHLLGMLKGHMAHHGYLTVGVALLLENAGLPVPGETILLLASFLAYSEHRLSLPLIILTGVIAATLGDNLGFAIGYYGGRRLLDRYQKTLHIRPAVIARGEELFARYGAATIFVARFIAGMRSEEH